MGSNSMRICKIFTCIISLIFILCPNLVLSGNKELFPELPFLIYNDAYSIEKDVDTAIPKKAVSYKIKIPFPAREVIDFYDKELKAIHFTKYITVLAKADWESFNTKNGEWERVHTAPAKYTSWWVDKNKKTLIILILFYKYNALDQHWRETLSVYFSINKMPLDELRSMGIKIKQEGK